MQSKSDAIREPAVRILYRASYPGDGALKHLETSSALSFLMDWYKTGTPGVVRDALAEAVLRIGGVKAWKDLTGNPAGVLVTLYRFGSGEQGVSFWLCSARRSGAVYECPTLLLSRLDEKGNAVERRELPLPAPCLAKPWGEGWETGADNIGVRFSD